jgi:hypothetical protein
VWKHEFPLSLDTDIYSQIMAVKWTQLHVQRDDRVGSIYDLLHAASACGLRSNI